MRVSIITPTYNSAKTIFDTLESIDMQTHLDIEHIIIDGLSEDDTEQIVARFKRETTTRKFISMKDEGIYDAMNRGFEIATGDIVCVLNSDDFYKNENVLAQVVSLFQDESVDYVYGDAEMINNKLETVRHWQVGDIQRNVSQIPHPCLWVRSNHLARLKPPFDVNYSIAADLKFQLTLSHKLKLKAAYLPETCVRMRMGGASNANISAVIDGWRQSRLVFNDVLGHGGLKNTFKKVVRKISGLLKAKLKLKI